MTGGFDGWNGPSPGGGGGGGAGVTSWNGLTGAVKGTLAEIYAFGLTDGPTTDNLFAMPAGHRRWSDTDATGIANSMISDGFFESATTPGDSRVPTFINRRYYNHASGVGSTVYDAQLGFDPTWNGTIAQLSDYSWTTDQAMFTFDASETKLTGAIYARRSYVAGSGGFNGPIAFPYVNVGTGQTNENVSLYNSFQPALNLVRTLNAWGQEIFNMLPLGAGITAQFLSTWSNSQVADAAGNGPGWFALYGSSTTPRAMVEMHMTTGAGQSGPWGVGLWAQDGTPTLQQVLEARAATGVNLFGGLQFPNKNSGTYPVSDATAARLLWDNTLSELMISKSGAAYTDILLGTTQANGAQAAIFGINLGPTNLTSLTPTLWAVTKINGVKYSFPLWPTT